MNKKICFLPGILNPGGIAHLMINLAKEFTSRGYEVDFILTKQKGSIENELPEHVNIHRFGNSSKGMLSGLIKYINSEKPLCIISGRDSFNNINYLACRLASFKTLPILSVHVDFSAAKKVPLRAKVYRLQEWLFGMFTYRFAKHIIAVSKGVAVNHAKRYHIDQEKIKVIYNPSYKNVVFSQAKESEVKAFVDKLERPVIIGVGRLNTQKGFEVLISAFKQFRDRHRKGSLLILGEGEERKKLEQLCQDLEISQNVHMPGYVKYPELYIENSDLFVMSSHWEGFGNVLVEALGMGSKIVSTDCPSGPAEILDFGRYGELVPTNNPEAMCQAIEKQLRHVHNPETQIGRAGEFSVAKIADQYLRLIDQAVIDQTAVI